MTEQGSTRASALLRERYDTHVATFSRSERIIADYLLALPPAELAFVSAEQLANATGTSDATVIRAARRLGFSGLPELKRMATRSVAMTVPVGERLEHKFNTIGTDPDKVATQTFLAAHEVLQSTFDALDQRAIDEAVRLLETAEMVWCLGIGTAEVPARHCVTALTRSGVRTSLSVATGMALANDMIALRGADVLLIFQAGRHLSDIDKLLDHAAALGSKVILVSGVQLHERYRDRVVVSLICLGVASRLASWAIGAITLVDLIVYGLSVRQRDRIIATHAALETLREKFL